MFVASACRASHDVSVSTHGILLPAVALAGTTRLALGGALPSREDIVVVVVGHLGQEVVSVLAFAFPVVSLALAFAAYEASDFPDWPMHMLAPSCFMSLVIPEQVFVDLLWCHTRERGVVVIDLTYTGNGVSVGTVV